MTQLGGRDVARVAQLAGFWGEEIKRAQAVAFAATRWNDHYEWDGGGVPSLCQWGLFATNPNDYDPANPRALFDAQTSARDAHRCWTAAGGVWDWHPVVRAFSGALVRGAWVALDEGRLWASRASSVTHLAVPFGHPQGQRPPPLPGWG